MRVALIGCGKAGFSLLEELVYNTNVSIIHIFDPNILEIKALEVLGSKIQLLSQCPPVNYKYDLVVIASPDETHFEFAIKSLENGAHCFIEKPIVTNSRDLVTISKLVDTNHRIELSTNFILRDAPLFIRLRELISDNCFGSKLFIEGKYLYGRWNKILKGWRGSSHEDYSVILGGLIHLVDLCCYLTSNYDFKVEQERLRLTSMAPSHIKDFGRVRLQSEGIGICSLTTTFSSAVDHRRDLSVYGDLGWIEVIGESVKTGGSLSGLGLEKLSPRSRTKGSILREFIDRIQGQSTTSAVCPKTLEALKVHKLLLGNT